MGFLPPLLAAVGGAVTGGLATGTAATIIGGATAASAALSIGSSIAALASGPPKAPSTPTPAPTPPIASPAPAQQARPSSTANKSLAALSPGLALGGTASILGSAPSGNNKTLLGS